MAINVRASLSTRAGFAARRARCSVLHTALLLLSAFPAMTSAAATSTGLNFGLDSFNVTFNSQAVPVITYQPATYRQNPLIILIPGRSGKGIEFAQENVALAEFLNCLIAVPDFDTAGYGFEKTFYGGIYPASAYSANDSTLVPGATPRNRTEWTFNLVSLIYKELKAKLNTTVSYILYGDDAGGFFVQSFAAFYYADLAAADRPKRMVAGVSSFYLFPAAPILNLDYLEPVNRTTCFTGEIPKLTKYIDPARYAWFGTKIKAAMIRVTTGDEAVTAIAQAQALLAEAYASPINRRLANLDDRLIYRAVDVNSQPPYPYGLGGLPATLTNPQQVKAMLAAPLVQLLTSRDTNVFGGVVEPNPPNRTNCIDSPSLKNNAYTEVQGPYRLARGLNLFNTARAAARSLKTTFGWRVVVCPGIGHDSIADSQCLQLYDGLLADNTDGLGLGDNIAPLADAIANPSFKKQYFVEETFPSTLTCK